MSGETKGWPMRFLNIALLLLVAAAPAAAQSSYCYKPASGGQRVKACTELLRSGRHSGQNLAIIHNNRGNGYLQMKRYSEAIADYRRAIDLNPLYPSPYYNRGNAYYSQRRYNWAIEDYSVAIRLRPKYPSAYGNRGLTHERLGKRAAAIRDFRAAIRQRPGDRVGLAGLKRLGVR